MAQVPTPIKTGFEPPSSSNHRTRPKVRPTPPSVDGYKTALYTPWQPNAIWGIEDDVTGFAPPTGKGYDANATKLTEDRKARAINQASGFLLDGQGGKQVPLFVTAINIDTHLAGSTAQSQLIQEFYPRNFVQPVINVYGMSLDQDSYGTLCEFVRNCQFRSLGVATDWPTSMTQLTVLGGDGLPEDPGSARRPDIGGRSTGRSVSITFTTEEGQVKQYRYHNQTIRGPHNNVIAKGFITSMPRIHRRFQYAVAWQLDFTVAAMIEGPFKDNPATLRVPGPGGVKTWIDMVKEAESNGLSSVSAKQNRASLAFAASRASTFTPSGG